MAKSLILSRRDWGEADELVLFFSHELGWLRGVAKNAKRSRVRFGGHLEGLSLVDLVLRPRQRDELVWIDESTVLEGFLHLRSDPLLTGLSFYFLEISSIFLGQAQPDQAVFDFLLSFLRQGEARQLTVVLKMVNEIRLLGLLGFEPRFSTCGRCGRELGVSEDVCFSPELGGACHHGCADSTTGAGYHLSAATMAVLRRGLALDWDAAARLRLREKGVTEARTALSAFVRHIRGEEIKSLEFIEKLTVWACSQRERAGG